MVANIPDPAVVVLVGASGSGKSTWAAARYRSQEIVSSDALRAVVGSGPHDLGASTDAFVLLDQIVAARTRRGLTTVVDTLGLEPARRADYLRIARQAGLPAIAVLFETDAATCRLRNADRDRPVPSSALETQLRRMRVVPQEVDGEPWDTVVRSDQPTRPAPLHIESNVATSADATPADARREPGRPGFVLQIARFPWGTDPAGWLASVATAAAEVGFEGLALMDHLIQIPQVGRPWDPMPEPWVTLGLLAGLTPDLRLGTLCTPVTFRPPGVIAKAVATLDALSGGRAFCGIGAGWWEREHDAFGLPFPPAPDRLDQLEVAIETMRALWSTGTKPYAGRRIRLPETTCYPRPASPVRLIVGGNGERRTLRIAARYADACNLPSELSVLDRKLKVLHQHCADVGRDPAEVAITVLDIPIMGADRDEVATKVERLRGRTAAAQFARRHHAGEMADHVERYRLLADRGVETVFVSLPDLTGPGDVHRWAPLLGALA